MRYIKLGDICEIKSSKRIYQSDYVDEGIPFYRGKEISQLSRNEDIEIELYISKEKYTDLADRFGSVKKGDLLITSVGTIGNTWVSDGRKFYYKDGNITQIIDNDRINTKFISYLFKSDFIKNQYLKGTSGTAQIALSIEKLKKIVIPDFSLETQNKIVEVLDKAQDLIDKKIEQIDLLDELVKSRFIEMFGNPISNPKSWKTSLLGEICELKAGKNIKASEIYEEQTEELYPCYGGNGLRGYVDRYSHNGNINLIGRQGALCGNVKYARGKFYATEHAVVTQPKIDINSYWLHFVLTELDLNRLSSGAAQPGLTVGALNKVEIIQPPIELQNEFAAFVEKVDSVRAAAEKSLQQLNDNFNSLMQKAFKGELF